MKHVLILICFVCLGFGKLLAQDFIVKNNDEVIRGTIKGTDYFAVFISANDEADVVLAAKDVKNFFWNGDTYLSKGFPNGKNFEYRFVKVIEMGTVNLYAFGGGTLVPQAKEKRARFRPNIGIGMGSGGFGGMGLGGGISIGSNRNDAPQNLPGAAAVRYFIEKPGTGPIQELPIRAITADEKKAVVKNILLQKLGDLPEIKTKIDESTELNSREVINFVRAYNQVKK